MSRNHLTRIVHHDAESQEEFLAVAHRIRATRVIIMGVRTPMKGGTQDSMGLECLARADSGNSVSWKPGLPAAPHDPDSDIATTFEVFLTAVRLRNELLAKEPHWICSLGLFGGAMEPDFQRAVVRDATAAGAIARKLLV